MAANIKATGLKARGAAKAYTPGQMYVVYTLAHLSQRLTHNDCREATIQENGKMVIRMARARTVGQAGACTWEVGRMVTSTDGA